MQKKKEKSSSKQSSEAFLKEVLVELANMRDDGITRFRKRWGQRFGHSIYHTNDQLLLRRDELRLLWREESGIIMELAVGNGPQWEDGTPFPGIPERAADLHEHWLTEAGLHMTLGEYMCTHWLRQEGKLWWVIRWTPTDKRILAKSRSLSATVALGCMANADRMGYCRNPECPAPYFLAKRRDQKYCSDICATPAKKAAKLKWWHEHRGKTSQDKKSSK